MESTPTHSMCNVCYKTISAHRLDDGQVVTLVKTCPEHGTQTAVREPNSKFNRWVREVAFDREAVEARIKATMINTTDRCNLACPQCYHQPDESQDPPIKDVVAIAKMATRPVICMLGAEATMRPDLPELVDAIRRETGRYLSLYTNGVKLASARYLSTLAEAGLTSAAVSLQSPEYVGRELYETKLKAIANLKASSVHIWHVAFSICTPADVGPALDTALSLDLPEQTYIRMRVTGTIGTDIGTPMALSELVQTFSDELAKRGLSGQVLKGSHPYVLIVRVQDRNFFLLRWPSVEEVDLDDLASCPARGLLVPEEGETPLIHQMLLFAHRRALMRGYR